MPQRRIRAPISGRTAVAPPIAGHGAVLAGGASRRFGQDKAFVVVAGRRMIDAVAAALGRGRPN